MNHDLVRVAKAVDFAARKHRQQRRKGATAEPYFNHLSEVARYLAEATNGEDPDLVIAGYLHDAIEDQGITREEVAREFGEHVALLVVEVTDDKSLDKAERKRLQIEHAPRLSHQAKALKLADKISNLRAISTSPPVDWSLERQREYFDWAKAVVDGCRGVNPHLETWFDAAYSDRP